ncbi:MAG: GNAT family N-acetyltransferase [Candidatus Aenigmatarchaeota archaeon]
MKKSVAVNTDTVLSNLNKVRKDCLRSSENIKYVVRTARKADSDALAGMYKTSFPEYPYKQLHDPAYHANPPDHVLRIVAEMNMGIVGAAALEVDPPCLLGEVKQVVTRPDWRSKGIASELVGECVEIAEEVGLEKLYAHVRTREPSAQALFIKHKFKPVCIMKGHFIVYHEKPVRENMIYMERFINGSEKLMDKVNLVDPEITKSIFKEALYTHYLLRMQDSEKLL